MKPVLYAIVESPVHPNFSALYEDMGYELVVLNSMRKAMTQMKKQPPDYIVCEFFYGYGNNYAGINVSNLDVMLRSLQRYAPGAKVIAFVDKEESKYVSKLTDLFPLHAVLQYPVRPQQVEEALNR